MWDTLAGKVKSKNELTVVYSIAIVHACKKCNFFYQTASDKQLNQLTNSIVAYFCLNNNRGN